MAAHLAQGLEAVGGELLVTRFDATEFFDEYYSLARKHDLYFLGSNFNLPFDPSAVFANPALAEAQQAFLQAESLRKTPQGNVRLYEERWLQLQKIIVENLPVIPLYSNVYTDAFTAKLVNYHPESHHSWAQAILYASLLQAAQ